MSSMSAHWGEQADCATHASTAQGSHASHWLQLACECPPTPHTAQADPDTRRKVSPKVASAPSVGHVLNELFEALCEHTLVQVGHISSPNTLFSCMSAFPALGSGLAGREGCAHAGAWGHASAAWPARAGAGR